MDQYLIPDASFLRLYEDYVMHNGLVVAFDFDNTVFDFHNKGNTYDEVIQLLHDLRRIGCFLICWTANEDFEFVSRYMIKSDIPFDVINENPPFFKCTSRKIYYNVLLDDRAGLKQTFDELTELVAIVKKTKQIK